MIQIGDYRIEDSEVYEFSNIENRELRIISDNVLNLRGMENLTTKQIVSKLRNSKANFFALTSLNKGKQHGVCIYRDEDLHMEMKGFSWNGKIYGEPLLYSL